MDSRLSLDRALDTVSRGVLCPEQFLASKDLTFCIVIDGFTLICPNCESRLGDSRPLLRELLATHQLHSGVFSRIIQEVSESSPTRTFCFSPLSKPPAAQRTVEFNSEIVSEARIFHLPLARVVPLIPQPTDFNLLGNGPSGSAQRNAIPYFVAAVDCPLEAASETASEAVPDSRQEISSNKRGRLSREVSELFQARKKSYLQSVAIQFRQSATYNEEICGQSAMQPETSHSDEPFDFAGSNGPSTEYLTAVLNHPTAPCELLEAGHARFAGESDHIRSRRLTLIHALKAIASELVRFPGMTQQLVAKVAHVEDPSEQAQAEFVARKP